MMKLMILSCLLGVASLASTVSAATVLTTAQIEIVENVMRTYKYPEGRYEPFADLSNSLRNSVTGVLGYTEVNWNRPGRLNSEYKKYNRFNAQENAIHLDLGFTDEPSWTCWSQHFYDFNWLELDLIWNVQQYYDTLGWNQDWYVYTYLNIYSFYKV